MGDGDTYHSCNLHATSDNNTVPSVSLYRLTNKLCCTGWCMVPVCSLKMTPT